MGKLLKLLDFLEIKSKCKDMLIISGAVISETIFITYPAICSVMGLGFWSAWSESSFIMFLVVGLAIGLAVGLIVVLIAGLVVRRAVEPVLGHIRGFGLFLELVLALAFGLAFELIYGLVVGPVFLGFARGFAYVICLLIAVGLTLVLSISIWIPISRGLSQLSRGIIATIKGFFTPWRIKEYPFGRAVASLLVMYIFIALIFSLWFYACYLEGIDICYQKNPDENPYLLKDQNPYFCVTDKIKYPEWIDFIYFSFVTIATLGYGDITPIHHFPQLLAVFEIILGVGLIGVFLVMIMHVAGQKGSNDKGNDEQPDY